MSRRDSNTSVVSIDNGEVSSTTALALTDARFDLAAVDFQDFSTRPDTSLEHCGYKPFDLANLAAAFHQKCTPGAIRRYIQRYDKDEVKSKIHGLVHNHHIVTYAIHYHSVDCLRLLLEYGVDPQARDFGRVPVLAYAIMLPYWNACNTLEMVRTLLAHGASALHIPRDMWIDYVKTPSSGSDVRNRGGNKWCTVKVRKILVETMHLSIRYTLWRASRLEFRPCRMLQIAEAKGILPLLRIPYLVIGQELGIEHVIEQIYAHIANDVDQPLVLAFSGLSGHGKTELASCMGGLISADFIDIDCTQITTVFSLLGTTAGYQESENGSPLNNFLVRNNAKRNVVFLDEFDKTKREVREALLKVMDAGTYTGRPNNLKIDCTKTVWILATNKGDTEVAAFYAKEIAKRREDEIDQVDIMPLQIEIAKLLSSLYSPAVCGRINAFIPFFPFSPGEQAVVAHKFILNLQDRIRKPIDLKQPVCRYIGHSILRVVDDGRLCQKVAEGYVQALGARSLKREVTKVEKKFLKEYSKVDEVVTEASNQGKFERYIAQLQPVSDGVQDIVVYRDTEKD
ncbi:P-loop containing nucleoside triphosphate hydrolase [Lecanosticta acicola]|uniref:P-loop containing nucleoside triphosphate hydrolase n=1 Tax=Lecanosticta acicola TaxID=111012 RepID=A0AAI8YRY0_9PEZI|nr:P-loop containing nucleoside triphosphate hydrolase [Lecanosticta acicola]